jgi:hypothetical protein
MGILEVDKIPTVVSPAASRRKSGALNFGSLKPLDAASGTKNFGGYRDRSQQSPKAKVKTEDTMYSDADDDDDDDNEDIKVEDVDEDKDESGKGLLSPEDALKQGELAEGVRKIKVCGHHLSANLRNPLTPHSLNGNTPPNPSAVPLHPVYPMHQARPSPARPSPASQPLNPSRPARPPNRLPKSDPKTASRPLSRSSALRSPASTKVCGEA